MPEALVDALVADWSEHGRAAVEDVRRWMPHRYHQLIAALTAREPVSRDEELAAKSEDEIKMELDRILIELAAHGYYPGPVGPPLSIRAFNPMQPENLGSAPRCGARTRSGAPCRSPAVGGNARCRMHGGKAGAPLGNSNAEKPGVYSRRVRVLARYLRAMRNGAYAVPPEEVG